MKIFPSFPPSSGTYLLNLSHCEQRCFRGGRRDAASFCSGPTGECVLRDSPSPLLSSVPPHRLLAVLLPSVAFPESCATSPPQGGLGVHNYSPPPSPSSLTPPSNPSPLHITDLPGLSLHHLPWREPTDTVSHAHKMDSFSGSLLPFNYISDDKDHSNNQHFSFTPFAFASFSHVDKTLIYSSFPL